MHICVDVYVQKDECIQINMHICTFGIAIFRMNVDEGCDAYIQMCGLDALFNMDHICQLCGCEKLT